MSDKRNLVEDALKQSIALAVSKETEGDESSPRFSEFVTTVSLMSEDQWTEFYDMSRRHGVSALTFSAVQKLPKEVGVPRDLLFSWLANSESIKSRYSKQCGSANAFTGLMADNGLGVVILKGIGLASKYYPEAALRECGDVDVYVYELNPGRRSGSGEYALSSGYEKCDRVIEQLHKNIDRSTEKHSVFTFNGVTVENHKTFVSVTSKSCRLLNSILEQLIERDILKHNAQCHGDIYNPQYRGDIYNEQRHGEIYNAQCRSEIYNAQCHGEIYPGADFNALFLLRHIVSHLSYEGVTLHNIIDWGLFLLNEKESIDWAAYSENLEKTGLTTAFAVFTSIAADVIGVSVSELCLLGGVSESVAGASGVKEDEERDDCGFAALKNRVEREIMEVRLHKEAKLPFFRRLSAKTKRLFSNRWQFGTVNPDSFWKDALLPSIISHIKFPNKI